MGGGGGGCNHGITVYRIYCPTIIQPLGPSHSLSHLAVNYLLIFHQLLKGAETSIEDSIKAPPVSYFSGRLFFFLSSAAKRRPIGSCFDSWRAFDDELLANINSVCFPLNLKLHNWSAESKNVLLKIDMTNPLLAAVKVGCDEALLTLKARGKKWKCNSACWSFFFRIVSIDFSSTDQRRVCFAEGNDWLETRTRTCTQTDKYTHTLSLSYLGWRKKKNLTYFWEWRQMYLHWLANFDIDIDISM